MATLSDIGPRFAEALKRAGHAATWLDISSALVVDGTQLVLEKWHGRITFRHKQSSINASLRSDAKRLDKRHTAPVVELLHRVKEWEAKESMRSAVKCAASSLVTEFDSDDMAVSAAAPRGVWDGDVDKLKLCMEYRKLTPYEARTVLLAAKQAL